MSIEAVISPRILTSQQQRLLVAEALRKGSHRAWDFQPVNNASNSYMRNHLDLDDLLQQIPRLIARLIKFEAFAVYLLDERRGEIRSAYLVGYPDPITPIRLRLGQGLVGAAIASEQPLLVSDVTADPGRHVTNSTSARCGP